MLRGLGAKSRRVGATYEMHAKMSVAREPYTHKRGADGGMAVLIARYPCITYQKEILKVKPVKVEIRHMPLPEKGLPRVRSGNMDRSLLPSYKDMIAPGIG